MPTPLTTSAGNSSKATSSRRALRVLHVNKLYAPWTGGIESVAQELSEGLACRNGFQVEVLACQSRGRGLRELFNGVRVLRAGSLGLWLGTPIAPGFSAQLARRSNDFDVIHVHMPTPLALWPRWWTKAIRPRIVVQHHCNVVRPVARELWRALVRFEQELYDRADAIIVSSEAMIESSAAVSGHRNKCHVIRLPVPHGRSGQAQPTNVADLRAGLGIGSDERVVLFVGRLVPYKGIEYLIEAMRGIAARLVLVGSGPLVEALRHKVESLGMANQVIFAGAASDAKVRCFYSLADLFVLPSITSAEAYGLVQLEAMSFGVPVINTDLPTGVPTVSLHGHTGLTVPTRDSAALAAAIRVLMDNDDLRQTFSCNARKRAQLFSRDTVVAELAELYLALCKPARKLPVWHV
jgi:rhamnosyl/mannosyltransferase